MTEVEIYKNLKDELWKIKDWWNMYGLHYSGGNGGVGEIRSVEVSATIYYQQSNGSKNYHESSGLFNKTFGKILQKHPELFKETIEVLEKQLQEQAGKARVEHEQIMRDSGL